MQQPDMQKLYQFAQSPAGQQLMQMLKKQDLSGLAPEASSAQLKEALSPLLKDPQVRSLLKQLEGKL